MVTMATEPFMVTPDTIDELKFNIYCPTVSTIVQKGTRSVFFLTSDTVLAPLDGGYFACAGGHNCKNAPPRAH